MFKWIGRALKVMGVLSVTVPAVLVDGTITVAECLDLCKKLFEAFDVKMIVVPSNIVDFNNNFLEVKKGVKP